MRACACVRMCGVCVCVHASVCVPACVVCVPVWGAGDHCVRHDTTNFTIQIPQVRAELLKWQVALHSQTYVTAFQL